MDIVHGDLKGASKVTSSLGRIQSNLSNLQVNILVIEGGHACLADFGLATMLDNGSVAFTKEQVPDSKSLGTLPYMAPELHQGGKVKFESDIYAFACVCYEVCCILTVNFPFS